MVYNEVGGHIPGLYYPPPTEKEIKKRRNSISFAKLNSEDEGNQPLLLDDSGNPVSPKADDWFSPKLTHYTQGRA
jgi:hypothetical protein